MDKMREEFEAWALEFHGYSSGLTAGGFYYISKMDELWESWKASRAALCVELPELEEPSGVLGIGFNVAKGLFISRFMEAGIRYK